MAKKLFTSLPAKTQKGLTTISRKRKPGKSLENLRQQYQEEIEQNKKASYLLGLVDATGSMGPVWNQTKRIINEFVNTVSQYGNFNMHWVAYRDYDTPNNLIESSGWQSEVEPILNFVDRIKCIGGADIPEAVEKGLEFATRDDQCTTVVLIGDAPPHADRDYKKQAGILSQQGKPVYSFVVGNDQSTVETFQEISQITGGVSCVLTSAQDILDLLTLTVVANDFGPKELEKFLESFKVKGKALPAGAKKIINKHLPKSTL